MATISLLNLDQSYPVYDPYNSTNTVGEIRYINASDANGLSAMQRYMGDVFNRSLIVEKKVNELISAVNGTSIFGSENFDNTPYVLTDGTHPFTAPVKGVSPTDPLHLTTKGYTDNADNLLSASIQSLDAVLNQVLLKIPLIRASNWLPYTWQAGAKTALTFTINQTYNDLSNLISMVLWERLNLGTVNAPNYVYQQLPIGGNTGFKVDAMWVDDTQTSMVNVLVPNDVFYPSGYPSSSNYAQIQGFSERHLRVVLIHQSPN